MSWLLGTADLARRRWFEQVGPIVGPLAWITHAGSWNPGAASAFLSRNALTFVVAASRATVLSCSAGWPGYLAARFGALTAWSLLDGPVAPASGALSLNPNLDNMKDYFGLSAKGTIGAGFAILEMQALNYPWFGHWEEAFFLPGVKTPDFVFARTGVIAAVEAKCTEQVDPNLTNLLKGTWREQVRDSGSWGMDEGWVIATCFNDPAGAALERAFGMFPAAAAAAAAAAPGVAPAVGPPPPPVTFADAVQCVLHGMLRWVWKFSNQADENAQAAPTLVRGVIGPLVDSVRLLQANTDGNEVAGEPFTLRMEDGRMLRMTPLCSLNVLAALANALEHPNNATWPDPGPWVDDADDSMAMTTGAAKAWLQDGTGARFAWAID